MSAKCAGGSISARGGGGVGFVDQECQFEGRESGNAPAAPGGRRLGIIFTHFVIKSK